MQLRRDLESVVGREWGPVTEAMAAFRRRVKQRFPADPRVRRRILRAVRGLDLPALARKEGQRGVDRALRALLDRQGGCE